MSNVRLIFSVTGALLISTAAQAKATDRPDCWNKEKDANTCAKLASEEAERVEILREYTQLENCNAAVQLLKDAQNDSQAFQKKEEEMHLSLKALSLLLVAYEKAEVCCKYDDVRCPVVLSHIGNAIECAVAAINKQLPGDDLQQEIGDLKIRHFDRKEGMLVPAEDKYDLGVEVLELFE